jgi:6-pyruvoyltetrahydropterin/6-carboxytetrahydropterin synthase
VSAETRRAERIARRAYLAAHKDYHAASNNWNTAYAAHERARERETTVRIYKDFVLQSAHSLPLLPEGHPCRRVHGHNYKVRLDVEGPIDERYGWIVDYADVEAVWMRIVHARLDHRNINTALPELADRTTCENIAAWMWRALKPELPGLCRIEIQEEPTSGVVYHGPEA